LPPDGKRQASPAPHADPPGSYTEERIDSYPWFGTFVQSHIDGSISNHVRRGRTRTGGEAQHIRNLCLCVFVRTETKTNKRCAVLDLTRYPADELALLQRRAPHEVKYIAQVPRNAAQKLNITHSVVISRPGLVLAEGYLEGHVWVRLHFVRQAGSFVTFVQSGSPLQLQLHADSAGALVCCEAESFVVCIRSEDARMLVRTCAFFRRTARGGPLVRCNPDVLVDGIDRCDWAQLAHRFGTAPPGAAVPHGPRPVPGLPLDVDAIRQSHHVVDDKREPTRSKSLILDGKALYRLTAASDAELDDLMRSCAMSGLYRVTFQLGAGTSALHRNRRRLYPVYQETICRLAAAAERLRYDYAPDTRRRFMFRGPLDELDLRRAREGAEVPPSRRVAFEVWPDGDDKAPRGKKPPEFVAHLPAGAEAVMIGRPRAAQFAFYDASDSLPVYIELPHEGHDLEPAPPEVEAVWDPATKTEVVDALEHYVTREVANIIVGDYAQSDADAWAGRALLLEALTRPLINATRFHQERFERILKSFKAASTLAAVQKAADESGLLRILADCEHPDGDRFALNWNPPEPFGVLMAAILRQPPADPALEEAARKLEAATDKLASAFPKAATCPRELQAHFRLYHMTPGMRAPSVAGSHARIGDIGSANVSVVFDEPLRWGEKTHPPGKPIAMKQLELLARLRAPVTTDAPGGLVRAVEALLDIAEQCRFSRAPHLDLTPLFMNPPGMSQDIFEVLGSFDAMLTWLFRGAALVNFPACLAPAWQQEFFMTWLAGKLQYTTGRVVLAVVLPEVPGGVSRVNLRRLPLEPGSVVAVFDPAVTCELRVSARVIVGYLPRQHADGKAPAINCTVDVQGSSGPIPIRPLAAVPPLARGDPKFDASLRLEVRKQLFMQEFVARLKFLRSPTDGRVAFVDFAGPGAAKEAPYLAALRPADVHTMMTQAEVAGIDRVRVGRAMFDFPLQQWLPMLIACGATGLELPGSPMHGIERAGFAGPASRA
jgi:hypothetical protein